ncbi:hypothetical protein QP932_06870 [Corynebacterium freneyi]|uniref:hypothetical protein n=1 Tax=Corynebacterium freneyi TaxID=134034 RepID=UPI0025518F35|nr:hypothetical protein [Corynebacterium freneyi]MDK8768222.1 hypothetical protein [Corynebacterium freneyi]
MTTITLNIQWRGHQPGDTVDVDQATAEWLRRTGATAPDPELSNREHARRTGASDKTVQAVRADAEANAEIPHYAPGDRVEASGRAARGAAQQPSRPEPQPESEPGPASAPEAPADAPERPRKIAPVATWRAYAEDLGIDPKGLTKAEIIAATTGV